MSVQQISVVEFSLTWTIMNFDSLKPITICTKYFMKLFVYWIHLRLIGWALLVIQTTLKYILHKYFVIMGWYIDIKTCKWQHSLLNILRLTSILDWIMNVVNYNHFIKDYRCLPTKCIIASKTVTTQWLISTNNVSIELYAAM